MKKKWKNKIKWNNNNNTELWNRIKTQWLFKFIKIKLNKAQDMIENHNQTIDLLKFRSENDV